MMKEKNDGMSASTLKMAATGFVYENHDTCCFNKCEGVHRLPCLFQYGPTDAGKMKTG